MTEVKTETGTKKKLLIPVIALLICALGLSGAAYAYNSTFTVNDNSITGETFVLEVNNDSGTLITGPISIKAVDFTTETVLAAPAAPVDSVVVKANAITNAYNGTLVIKDSDSTTNPVTMAVSATATAVDGTITAAEVGGDSGTITYTVTVTLYSDSEYQNVYNGTATFAANHTYTLYYKVEVSMSGSITFNNGTPSDDVDAVKTQLADEKFTMSFSATAPGTA
jgi:hypothetical protein